MVRFRGLTALVKMIDIKLKKVGFTIHEAEDEFHRNASVLTVKEGKM